MMKIDSLTIRKFRGIKELTIPFSGKSWVIQGRNGSGKSGVVDAIEFGLSGSISRLSGEGRGEVSIKEHGPHVDFKNNPKDAEVSLAINFGNQNSINVTRNCGSPTKLIATPKDKEKQFVQAGSEIVLSRREILKFILTEPGKRSKEVQALLKIDKLDEIRSALQTAKNKVSKSFDAEKQEFGRMKVKLMEWTGAEELTKETLLASVNKHRKILALDELPSLDEDTQLNTGIGEQEKSKEYLNKKELTTLVNVIRDKLFDSDGSFSVAAKKYQESIQRLEGKEKELRNLNRIGFYESGLQLVDSGKCPFCENTWDEADLRKLVQNKVRELSGIKTLKKDVDDQIQKMKVHWRGLKAEVETYAKKSTNEPNLKSTDLDSIKNMLAELIDKEDASPDYLKDEAGRADTSGLNVEKAAIEVQLNLLVGEVGKLPEKSNEEKSKEFLVICQERLDNYRASKKKYEYQLKKSTLAETMLGTFNEVSESHLNGLYGEVEKDFSNFYRIVNHDDEAKFAGNLTAQKGSLNFEVDFYDRGKFPPAAYHSEGHQDGMGLCLYLALMKKIMGSNFTLAILDDVLMSVDSDHKKSFCKLLKQEFPGTQFIITTHDKYWQKQMVTEGLIGHSTTLHFKNWSVDTGPSVWDEKDSWQEIDELIGKENIPGASGTLRRFLEFFMDEMSVRLSASIPRSASGDHDLGELLTGATSRYGDLLNKSITSARSWGSRELEDKLKAEKSQLDERLKKTRSEMWGMNATVHFNSWADMGKSDFTDIRNAYFELVQLFKCTCNTLIHVIPAKGSSETMKCDCGLRTYNLVRKSD